jgi:voltage-gated potassium channel
VTDWRRLRLAASSLAFVVIAGTLGYLLLGFSPIEALYQTVITVTTVGFSEVRPFDTTGRIFTMFVVVIGAGTALYTTGILLESLVEGRITNLYGRRKMDQAIARMRGHVIVCGWGRVGHALSGYMAGSNHDVVVIDTSAEMLAGSEYPYIVGDATDDDVLRAAGIDHARALVTALDHDAGNVFITVSARSLRSDLFIVARALADSSESKLKRAGADRVVNPYRIGGARMAAFVLQPHVAEFLDVVMHDGSLEFRLEEVVVPPSSPANGRTLRELAIQDRTGALVLAMRDPGGEFTTNPPPDTSVRAGQIVIAVGTVEQLEALEALFSG